MNERSDRHSSKWHCIAWSDVNALVARRDCISRFHPISCKHVRGIVTLKIHQRDSSRSVRVVFYAPDSAENPPKLPLEVNHSVQSLVSSAAMPHRYATVVISPTSLDEAPRQWLVWLSFPEICTKSDNAPTLARARWLIDLLVIMRTRSVRKLDDLGNSVTLDTFGCDKP